MDAAPKHARSFYRRWVGACSLGWIVGLALVAGIATALDGVGISGAQAMVGLGFGAGVGYLQGRMLAPWLGGPRGWTVASTLGMGSVFILHDVGAAAGVAVPFNAPLYVLAGALVTGWWQRALLRRVSPQAVRWVFASLIGWGLPAVGVAMGEPGAAGRIGGIAALVSYLFGGVLLGASTGGILADLLRPRPE